MDTSAGRCNYYPIWKDMERLIFFYVGDNASLALNGNVKYRSKGLSLYYTQCGGLNYWQIFKKNKWTRAMKEARDLPVNKYDLVINDFDYITAESCRIHKRTVFIWATRQVSLVNRPQGQIKSVALESLYTSIIVIPVTSLVFILNLMIPLFYPL